MFDILPGSRSLCALGWGLQLAGRERTTAPEHRLCTGGPAFLAHQFVLKKAELLQLEGRAPLGHSLVPTVLSLAASSQPQAARPRMPSSLTGVAPEDVRITAMAQRVKEVLPHVPLEVIRIDLGR